MKVILLGAMLALSNQGSAYYQWFPYNAQVHIGSKLVSATAYNHYLRPIYCRGKVWGVSQFRESGFDWFRGPILPGESRWAYVSAWGNRYFINGWADIYSRF